MATTASFSAIERSRFFMPCTASHAQITGCKADTGSKAVEIDAKWARPPPKMPETRHGRPIFLRLDAEINYTVFICFSHFGA
jgi:hypothetical protein